MKSPLLTLSATLLLVLAAPVHAADAHTAHSDHGAMSQKQGAATTPLTDGVVKKVDKPGGKLTLSHGPLPNGMPAMTMAFRVKDATWLDSLKAGDKVRFAVDDTGGTMTVTRPERP